MGLDMYLQGERYIGAFTPEFQPKPLPCLESEVYRLGYWRKHPNLHGYIVNHFAEGVDECQRIWLGDGNILQIIQAVQQKQLPYTTGFFFGASEGTDEEIRQDLEILERALAWLKVNEKGVFRSVYYRASW